MSTISVIIPCLDDARLLEACLAALAAQTRPADEIVVVDNGSSDDSVAIAEAAGARVLHEARRGIWPATATGLDAATGEVLARLDADSVPPADWLERIEWVMDADDRPTAVTGPGAFYGGTPATRWIARYVYIGAYTHVVGLLLGHAPLFGSNYAIRRDAWLQLRDLVHRDRADVHDDLDLTWWLRPGMWVAYERTLVVGVSARPFDTWRGLGRRVRMGFHTLAVEWRAWPPLERLADRRRPSAAGPDPAASPEPELELEPGPDPEGDEPLTA
jgi:glycosyltransferase involved in cell wall biosynthesis